MIDPEILNMYKRLSLVEEDPAVIKRRIDLIDKFFKANEKDIKWMWTRIEELVDLIKDSKLEIEKELLEKELECLSLVYSQWSMFE